MATLSLADRRTARFAPYTTGEPIVLPKKGAAPKLQPRRLCGRACGRRSARRQRSLARCRGRLGQDHRVPRISLGPRPRRRRSDGHRAARHGARLERRAGADPPRARGRQGAAAACKIACGVGTDHLDAGRATSAIDDVIRAYEEQIEAIEAMGGRLDRDGEPRARARRARARRTTRASTAASCARCSEPVIIHWLGEMFDPALAGYWGAADHMAAMETCLGDPAGARRQDRRHQDLAAVEGEGDRHAPPPARRACACIPATTSTTPS